MEGLLMIHIVFMHFNMENLINHEVSLKFLLIASKVWSAHQSHEGYIKVAHCAFMQINCRLFPTHSPHLCCHRPTRWRSVSFGWLCRRRVSCMCGLEGQRKGERRMDPNGPKRSVGCSPDCFSKVLLEPPN